MKNNIIKTSITLSVLSIFAAVPVAFSQAQMQGPRSEGRQAEQTNQTEQSRLQELQTQLQQNQMRLQAIQQEAAQSEEVVAAQESYQEILNAKMESLDPEAAEHIEKKDEVYEKLVSMGSYDTMEAEEKKEYESLIQTYQEVEGKIQTVANEALNDAEVKEALQSFQQTVIAAMREVDENTDELLQKNRELTNEFQQLQQGAMGQQGG